jgi:hypothetical protein
MVRKYQKSSERNKKGKCGGFRAILKQGIGLY